MPLTRCLRHLPGVGRAREARLRENGYGDWSSLAAALDADLGLAELLRTPGGKGPQRRKRGRRRQVGPTGGPETLRRWREALDEARAARERRDWRWFLEHLPHAEHWRVLAEGFDDTLWLDIETTGVSREYGAVTVVGVLEGDEFCQWVWPRPYQELLASVEGAGLWVTFNGRSFDVPFLRHHVPGFPEPPAHVDLVDLKRALGIPGGLKSLERQLGLARDEEVEGLGGADAVILWFRALAGDEESYRRLCAYNRADVEMMPEVAVRLIARLAERAREPAPAVSTPLARGAIHATEPESYPSLAHRWKRRRPRLAGLEEKLVAACGEVPEVVGIDLSANPARPTGWTRCRGARVTSCLVYKDLDILALTDAARPALVSIDAPLSLPRGCTSAFDHRGGSALRDAERALRSRRVGVYPPLIPHMQGLTDRGIRLARELRDRGHRVIESFPGVAQDVLGLPRKQADLEGLRRGLRGLGFRLDGKRTHDELDAVTAALVGFFYLAGDYEAVGDPEEGQIIVPVCDTSPETAREAGEDY